MLEEALSSTTYSPAEAALTFLSFLEVELAAGGAAAESRFFKLFSLLCDRVFGEISTKEDERFQHLVGGWLGRHVKWERPNTSLSSPQRHRVPHRPTSSSTSVKTDPVVKLLGASTVSTTKTSQNPPQQRAMTLIEAFAKEAEHRPNVRYAFPFQGLPKSTQAAWLAIIDETLRGNPLSTATTSKTTILSENSIRLLGSLLRVKPLEQVSLRQYQQQKAQIKDKHRPLQLSPVHFQTRQPLSPLATQNSLTPTKDKDTSPKVSLSMLEYYLIVFLRFPLVPPPTSSQDGPAVGPTTKTVRSGVPVPTTTTTRRTEPYGDSVYYQLFQEYAEYYIPHSPPQGSSSGFAPLERPSELFVRILVGLWLEGQNADIWTTETSVKAFKDRKPADTSMDLNASFDLVKIVYNPPSPQITRCFHKLVAQAVTDGAILDMAKDMKAGYRGANPEILCLSPTMTILQPPFYNYIRGAFRHASIHARQSPFYAALNDWLVWLEPWNTRHAKGRVQTQRIMDTVSRTHHEATPSSRVTYPKGSQRSLFKDDWEPYIAANLHLYTVPLAIFLRRSRELDFSPREYTRSLNTVRRVLRVFSPEVVGIINKLLKKEAGSKWAAVVARHETNLDVFAPPSCERGLASCQDDMQNLLEEIYMQHMKKVDSMDIIDRTIANIEGFFGGGVRAGEEKELRLVISQAKAIVGFPADFEIIPKSRATSDAANNGPDSDTTADRAPNGYFSQKGIDRISTGAVKCSPLEIGYVGDRMLSRPRTFEFAFMIPSLVRFSDALNTKFGINPRLEDGIDDYNSIIPRRFNLRFLADQRNLVFLTILSWLLKKMMFG